MWIRWFVVWVLRKNQKDKDEKNHEVWLEVGIDRIKYENFEKKNEGGEVDYFDRFSRAKNVYLEKEGEGITTFTVWYATTRPGVELILVSNNRKYFARVTQQEEVVVHRSLFDQISLRIQFNDVQFI